MCHCEERSDVAISQYPVEEQKGCGEYSNFTLRGVEDAAPYNARPEASQNFPLSTSCMPRPCRAPISRLLLFRTDSVTIGRL